VRGVLGSPLHYAAAKGSPEACELLLRMKSDNVNCTNMRGETPLFRACCAYPESAETVKVRFFSLVLFGHFLVLFLLCSCC
jgi:hypothetical protein